MRGAFCTMREIKFEYNVCKLKARYKELIEDFGIIRKSIPNKICREKDRK